MSNILRPAIILVLVLPANAEIETAKGLLETYQDTSDGPRQLIEGWVIEFERGVAWADVYIQETERRTERRTERSKRRLLYCKGNLVLRGEQLMDILRREVEARPDEGKMNWRLVMLIALQKVFPCKS
jgi:hypothetical protein